jgi:hypothetical protein
LAAAFSSGRSRGAAKATTMANATARIIAPTPNLKSGSPSNRCVRYRSRTAESLYLPRRRVASTSNDPTDTRATRKTALGSPPSSADVPFVLPLNKRPLYPIRLTPSPPAVHLGQPARLYSETIRALRHSLHHIPPGFFVLHPRAKFSERAQDPTTRAVCLRVSLRQGAPAKTVTPGTTVGGFTPQTQTPCYKS